MNRQMVIWGRQFKLPVEYMCYENEVISPVQEESVHLFFEKSNELLSDSTKIKEYCLKQNSSEIAEAEIKNIFKYVMPVSIYVPQNKKKRRIALLCNYRFDMEHGLAIVFEDEKLKMIGPQDIVF